MSADETTQKATTRKSISDNLKRLPVTPSRKRPRGGSYSETEVKLAKDAVQTQQLTVLTAEGLRTLELRFIDLQKEVSSQMEKIHKEVVEIKLAVTADRSSNVLVIIAVSFFIASLTSIAAVAIMRLLFPSV